MGCRAGLGQWGVAGLQCLGSDCCVAGAVVKLLHQDSGVPTRAGDRQMWKTKLRGLVPLYLDTTEKEAEGKIGAGPVVAADPMGRFKSIAFKLCLNEI